MSPSSSSWFAVVFAAECAVMNVVAKPTHQEEAEMDATTVAIDLANDIFEMALTNRLRNIKIVHTAAVTIVNTFVTASCASSAIAARSRPALATTTAWAALRAAVRRLARRVANEGDDQEGSTGIVRDT
jgi:hypothetical protein